LIIVALLYVSSKKDKKVNQEVNQEVSGGYVPDYANIDGTDSGFLAL